MQCLKSAISNLSKRNISCIFYIYDQKCTNYTNLKKTILIFEVNTLNIAQILISKCKVLCKNKSPCIWNRKYFEYFRAKIRNFRAERDMYNFKQRCLSYIFEFGIWPNPIFLCWQFFELFFGEYRNVSAIFLGLTNFQLIWGGSSKFCILLLKNKQF